MDAWWMGARGRVRAAWWGAVLACSVIGCEGTSEPPAAGSSSGDVASGSSGDASTTGGTGATSRAETTLADTGVLDTSAGSSESGPPPGCGNGIVDPGERCDDPLSDPPTCSADCQYPSVSCDSVGLPPVSDCGNTLDDDGDGLVDLDDPDCLGPCDDHEHELAPGFGPGGSDSSSVDCYWDTDNFSGDDGCTYDLTCDPESPGAPDWPYEPSPGCDDAPPQSPECIDACGPLTPNGCDCFGCCVIDGQTVYLGVDESIGPPDPEPCAAASLEHCNGCTLHEECFNPCDSAACELCFLQAPERLAPGCDAPACPEGVAACTSSYECPELTTCRTGCCLGYVVSPG